MYVTSADLIILADNIKNANAISSYLCTGVRLVTYVVCRFLKINSCIFGILIE